MSNFDGSAPWIKIVTRIFESSKIIAIGELPDGDSLVLCWVRLLCLAGEQNRGGTVYLSESVAFTPDVLAAKWRCKPSIVQMALTVFQKFGMISIDQEGTILVLNWSRYQNEAGLAQIREQSLKQLEDRSGSSAQSVNERLARKRAKDAERQRRRRNKADVPVTPPDTHLSPPLTRDSHAPVTQPSAGNGGINTDVTLCHAPKKENKNKNIPFPAVLSQGKGQPANPAEFITDREDFKRLISVKILKKDPSRPWSYEADQNVDRWLPVPRVEVERIAWFRNLPDDGSPQLAARKKITETGLMQFWSDEFTRANNFWEETYGWREGKNFPVGDS